MVFFHLQIDLLPESSQSPRILSEVDAALKAKQMKADVDEYLKVFGSPLFFVLALQYQEKKSHGETMFHLKQTWLTLITNLELIM